MLKKALGSCLSMIITRWNNYIMAEINNLLRREIKFYISSADIVVLRQSLQEVMQYDSHADYATRHYTVSSIYFDTPYDTDLEEKLSGLLNRKKYRIRIYNHQDDYIILETKLKENTVINKEREVISRAVARKLLAGDYHGFLYNSSPYLSKTAATLLCKSYYPKVIVEYEREAYTLPFWNIRITFDTNLRTYNSETNLLRPKTASIPVFSGSREIMEVKYDFALPIIIKKVLSRISSEYCAISKYALCRRFIKQASWEDN
jgi:hypothetical protein